MDDRRRGARKPSLQGDSCGCGMGARFMGAAFAASLVWYVWHWKTFAHSFWGACWRILAFSFAAAIIGKLVGILLFRRNRSRRPAAPTLQQPEVEAQ